MTAKVKDAFIELQYQNPYQPTPLRMHCLTCSRWLDWQDMLWGFCPYCMEERARNMVEQFRPVDASKEIFPRCAECNQEIIEYGMKTWDTLGKSFKLVCISCGYTQVSKDRQYQDTPWGREKNLK